MASQQRQDLSELLSAHLDGELAAQEAEQVERLLRENATARQALDELRRLSRAVQSIPRRSAPAVLADELRQHVERHALLGDVPEVVTPRRRFGSRAAKGWAMAAVLVLSVGGGWWTLREFSGPRSRMSGSPAPFSRDDPDNRESARAKDSATEVAARTTPEDRFEVKRARGVSGPQLRRHPFSAETNRVQITVGGPEERDRLVERVVRRLESEHVPAIESLSSTIPSVADGAPVFVSGTPGVNFSEESQRQILVQAPADRMERLLDELSGGSKVSENLTLVLAADKATGLENARSLLRQSSKPSMSAAPPPPSTTRLETKSESPPPPKAEISPVLAEILKLAGIEPDPSPQESDAPSTAVAAATPNAERPDSAAASDSTAPSLVKRRMAELEDRNRTASANGSARPVGKLITLVFEFDVNKPQPAAEKPKAPETPAKPSRGRSGQ